MSKKKTAQTEDAAAPTSVEEFANQSPEERYSEAFRNFADETDLWSNPEAKLALLSFSRELMFALERRLPYSIRNEIAEEIADLTYWIAP